MCIVVGLSYGLILLLLLVVLDDDDEELYLNLDFVLGVGVILFVKYNYVCWEIFYCGIWYVLDMLIES